MEQLTVVVIGDTPLTATVDTVGTGAQNKVFGPSTQAASEEKTRITADFSINDARSTTAPATV